MKKISELKKVPSLITTMREMRVGKTLVFACTDFSYTQCHVYATRLTQQAKRKGDTHDGRMFTVSTKDHGKTVTITRNW